MQQPYGIAPGLVEGLIPRFRHLRPGPQERHGPPRNLWAKTHRSGPDSVPYAIGPASAEHHGGASTMAMYFTREEQAREGVNARKLPRSRRLRGSAGCAQLRRTAIVRPWAPEWPPGRPISPYTRRVYRYRVDNARLIRPVCPGIASSHQLTAVRALPIAAPEAHLWKPALWRPLRDVAAWHIQSQFGARRNALVAATALAQRRRELREQDEFLEDLARREAQPRTETHDLPASL